MSVATTSPSSAASETASHVQPPATVPAGEACPLCGAPLHPQQEWCLRCGAAARTRLAASPNWKAPIATALVVVVLSLGVLAAALVKLAGDSGSATAPSTTTVTGPATAAAPIQTATTPATTAPGTIAPGTRTPGITIPRITLPGVTTPGAARTSPKRLSGLVPPVEREVRERMLRGAKGK